MARNTSRLALSALTLALAAAAGQPAAAQSPKSPDAKVEAPLPGALSSSLVDAASIDLKSDRAFSAYIRRRYFNGHEAVFNVSVNQGATWRDADQRISTNFQPGSIDGDMKLAIARSSGDQYLYVLFANRNFDNGDFYVVSSSDRGETFSNPINLALLYAPPASQPLSYGHTLIAVPGGKAHAIWHDESEGSGLGLNSVYIRSTSNGGGSWAAKKKLNIVDLSAQVERATEVSACADNNRRVHVAWKDKRHPTPSNTGTYPGRILIRSSADDAGTWGPEKRLDSGDTAPTNTESELPKLACFGTAGAGTVAAAWQDVRGGDWDVYFNISRDGGATWLPADLRIDPAAPAGSNAKAPKLVASQSPERFYLAWEDSRHGGRDLYFAVSADGGATWSEARRVNLGVAAGTMPVGSWDLVASGLHVTLVFADNRNAASGTTARDVFSVESHDGGLSFLPERRLDLGADPGASNSVNVVASASGASYLAVYPDYRDNATKSNPYGNGVGQAIDPNDPDADGVPNDRDNCDNYPNASQVNADFDRFGDLCDPFRTDPDNDIDSDGFPSTIDNCPDRGNLFQENGDGDKYGDFCDYCPATAEAVTRDLDRDGTGDACDGDIDNDGQVNGADADDDGDGIADASDNCDWVQNARQPDENGDGEGDDCDTNDLIAQNVRARFVTGRQARLEWEIEAGAQSYNVYFGLADRFKTGHPGFCYRPQAVVTRAYLSDDPEPGGIFWYLVTARDATTEGSAGRRSDGTPRPKPSPCDVTAANDWDGDGAANFVDNCRFDANADQADTDRDGRGNACDAFPGDPTDDAGDRDGVGANLDNCPFAANASQADADGDGVGDACDLCPVAADPFQQDGDRDGLGDACDADADGDGELNATDPDDDGDGVLDGSDNCALNANDRQLDLDADGTGDACDRDDREVNGLTLELGAPDRLLWSREQGATSYSVYSDLTLSLGGAVYGQCYRPGTPVPFTDSLERPAPGLARWYLVTGFFGGTQGTAGRTSDGIERQVPAGCP
ncbi:MAG: thrombospondin type 3 repeat-containing protein [Acidobacteria bacterium]|nr:thrombospondin type 3 repeat-containing protein [Acidobacteriota bacterium]